MVLSLSAFDRRINERYGFGGSKAKGLILVLLLAGCGSTAVRNKVTVRVSVDIETRKICHPSKWTCIEFKALSNGQWYSCRESYDPFYWKACSAVLNQWRGDQSSRLQENPKYWDEDTDEAKQ